ncbi:MAG: DUF4864 domain-containing protein [Verrucomicrobiota bacterium]|nr:DUF4864 domain-containing protein [Verrucomicrobiota bacterium]
MTSGTKAVFLSLFLLICALGFIVTQRLRERVAPPAPHDLFAIVNQQLAACRSSDIQSVYRHAAAGVQQRFSLPQFEKMVRERYPTMLRGSRVEFGLVRAEGANAVLQVFFLAADGSVRSFLYSFVHEDEAWKIDGVEELQIFQKGDRLAGTHA